MTNVVSINSKKNKLGRPLADNYKEISEKIAAGEIVAIGVAYVTPQGEIITGFGYLDNTDCMLLGAIEYLKHEIIESTYVDCD